MKTHILLFLGLYITFAGSAKAENLEVDGIPSDRFFYRNEGSEKYIILKKNESASFYFEPSVSITTSTLSLTFNGGTVASGSGVGPYAVTYATEGGSPNTITFSVDRPDPEDSEKTCTTTDSIAGRVVVPKITIDKVWSDQYPNRENVNFFTKTSSAGTGKDGKGYILMAERNDGTAYARATITMTPEMPELKELLIVRFGTMSGATFSGTGEGSIEEDSLTANMSDGTAPSEVIVAAGLDFNKNGELESSEVFDKTQYKLRIVGTTWYNTIRTGLTGGSTIVAVWPADEFLATFCFDDATMVGAATNNITANKSEIGHAVGALYGANGDAEIREFAYPSTGSMSAKIIGSDLVQDLMENACIAHAGEVTSHFSSNPTASPKTFNWKIVSGVATFDFWDDTELWGSYKSCGMDLDIAVTVDNTLAVTNVKITGTVTDQYDWDYDMDNSAAVQAGYNTLGVGGHVYRVKVAVDKDLVTSYHF